MSEPFIGEIKAFGGNFAPRGWAFCDGQLLAISQNEALFSILGTTYGGDGRTTFSLPDLRGRSIVHKGNGPGLPSINLGQKGGQTQVTLNINQIPSHNHTATLHAESAVGSFAGPQGKMLGVGSANVSIYAAVDPVANKTMAADSIVVQNNGGGQPLNMRSPFTAVSVIIALVGTFPSRN